MISKRKILGIILGTGAVGGGVTTYLYLKKSEALEVHAEEVLDTRTRNRNWLKNRSQSPWKIEYDKLDFGLEFTQKALNKTP